MVVMNPLDSSLDLELPSAPVNSLVGSGVRSDLMLVPRENIGWSWSWTTEWIFLLARTLHLCLF